MERLKKFNKVVDNITPNQALSKEVMGYLASMLLSKDGTFDQVVTSDFPDFKEMKGIQALLKRIEHLTTLKMSLGATLLIGNYIKNFGEAVVYAFYLNRKCEPGTLVTVDVFSDIFPWGMLSEKQIEDIWKAQKVHGEKNKKEVEKLKLYGVGDNLLDYAGTWEKEVVDIEEK
jgi:hypothetical protein